MLSKADELNPNLLLIHSQLEKLRSETFDWVFDIAIWFPKSIGEDEKTQRFNPRATFKWEAGRRGCWLQFGCVLPNNIFQRYTYVGHSRSLHPLQWLHKFGWVSRHNWIPTRNRVEHFHALRIDVFDYISQNTDEFDKFDPVLSNWLCIINKEDLRQNQMSWVNIKM